MARSRAGLRRLRLGSSVHPSATTEGCPFEQDIAHRLLQSKPKLEHAHERSSPRLRRAFHAEELRFESARAIARRLPGWHAPVARACLRTDRSAAEPAWWKAPEPTRPLNQTPLSQARDSSHWRAMNWFQSSPRSASSPPRERTGFRTNQGAFSCKRTHRAFDPAGPA